MKSKSILLDLFFFLNKNYLGNSLLGILTIILRFLYDMISK